MCTNHLDINADDLFCGDCFDDAYEEYESEMESEASTVDIEDLTSSTE